MSTRSNAEVDRAIAVHFEGVLNKVDSWAWKYSGITGDFEPLPFSTDYNAAHAAWARLTEYQKNRVVAATDTGNMYVACRALLDATPRQLCDWILAVVEGAER